MKQSIKGLYILLVTSLLLAQGCQVQQRRYTGGLSIQWPSINTNKSKSTPTPKWEKQSHQKMDSPKAEYYFNSATTKDESDKPPQEVKMPETPEEIAIEQQVLGDDGNNHRQLSSGPSGPSNPTSTLHHSQKSMLSAVQLRHQLQLQRKHAQQHQRQHQRRPGDPLELIFMILGLIGMLLGYDTYSDGGGGWGGGGRGGYFDWTTFWAIASIVIAVGGVVAAIALKGELFEGVYYGVLIIPFTVLGLPAGIIGLIKSTRDYYEVGRYLSIAALVLLGVMWIIGLT